MNNLGTIYCPFLHVNILLILTPQSLFFLFFFYHLSYFSMQYMFSYFLIYTVIHSQESMHSHMWLFAIPCKVAHQDPLSMDFPTRILEWIAIFSSRGSSQPRDRTYVSICTGRQILDHWATWGAPTSQYPVLNEASTLSITIWVRCDSGTLYRA